jgi:hypothetical protein
VGDLGERTAPPPTQVSKATHRRKTGSHSRSGSKVFLYFWHLGYPADGGYPDVMLRTNPKSTRRRPRYQVNLPARMLVHKPGLLRIAHVRGQELNAGGMAVNAIVELAVGDEVQLEFMYVRSRRPIRLRAAVRNRVDHQYGLEFLATNPAEEKELKALRRMIARR